MLNDVLNVDLGKDALLTTYRAIDFNCRKYIEMKATKLCISLSPKRRTCRAYSMATYSYKDG